MGMIFSLVDAAQQWINENVSPHSESPSDYKVKYRTPTSLTRSICLYAAYEFILSETFSIFFFTGVT